jgi:HEAT repeat protein
MKPAAFVLSCVMALFLAGNAFAGDDKAPAATFDKERAVTNLIIGLGMNNCGVEHDAAWLLGDLKSSEAVIPLLTMLHTESDCECCRVAAALALSRIGDARGTYAVKQAVKHDSSRKVRNLCAYFYNEYVQPGTFEFIVEKSSGELIAVAAPSR